MKRIIFLIVVLFSVMGLHAQQYYGMVSDPDGYANIRKGPSTSSPIVSRYQSGYYLYYTSDKNGWCKVYSSKSSKSFLGYMYGNRIIKINPNASSYSSVTYLKCGQVYDRDGYTNIRKGPSSKSPIVGRYRSGDYLYYVPDKNDWCKVYSGTSSDTFMGYMHSSRIIPVN